MSDPQAPGAPEPPSSEDAAPETTAPETTAPENAVAASSAAQPTAEEGEDRPSTWQPLLYLKIGLLLFAIAYSTAFVVGNTDEIDVDFVFATAKVHLIWEILLLLAVGLVGGVLLSQLYRHRRRASLAKKAREPGDTGPNVGG